MICHLVFYRTKQGLNEQDEIRLMEEARRRLPKVPGVMNLKVGRSLGGTDQGFTIALAMDFTDVDALEAYRVHPDHQKFVTKIAEPLLENVWRYDFEWK